MKYILISPDNKKHDITDSVKRGMQNIHEIAFDLESSVLPSSIDVEVDNTEGNFDPVDGLINKEITEYILQIKENEQTVFVGIITDVEFCEFNATLKVRSVVQFLANASIGNLKMTGTPAEIVKTVLLKNLTLPGLFVDTINFDNVSAAEKDRKIEIVVKISAKDSISLASFLQEVNKVTGLYIYSQNGILTCLRYGEYSKLVGFDYFFSAEVVAGKTKRSRPILWQKTRVLVPYYNGTEIIKAAKNMADYFGVVGQSIIEKNREKILETDGLAGKLYHSNIISAETCLRDLLGWRGFPRWKISFEVDVIDQINRSKLIEIPLFSRTLYADQFGFFVGGLIEKKIYESKAELTLMSISNPEFHHPAKILFPGIKNYLKENGAFLEIINNSKKNFEVEYKFEDGTACREAELKPLEEQKIENKSKTAAFVRVGIPHPAGVNWYKWRKYNLPWEGK